MSNENEQKQNTTNDNFSKERENDTDKWIKFLILSLAVIVGTFLAVYFISEQAIKHAVYGPAIHHQKLMNKMMNDNIKYFDKLERSTLSGGGFIPMDTLSFSQISHLQEDENGYKLFINLKHFDNDINKVKLDIKPDKVSILASNDRENKTSVYSLSYSQTYILDEKINTKEVTKEVHGDNAIVYLPFADKD